MLVSSTTPLGYYIDYEIAPHSRLDYIQRWTPDGINFLDLAKVFKRDIILDSLVERISNVNVYYIETMHGRGDELYYFSCNNYLFHGEKIWSHYHPFLTHLPSISPTAEVVDSSWFVGSRNNYTHQLIDFLPNLIYRATKGPGYPGASCVNVFGKTNNILASVSEISILKRELNRPKLFLEELGHPVKHGPWRIRCIKFRDMFLVRHLSIFKAFSLVKEAFDLKKLGTHSKNYHVKNSTLYLSRADNRVLNQELIEAYLLSHFEATIMKDMHAHSFAQKKDVLSSFDRIIMPPGSDNINALCFSDATSILFQMIPVPTNELLASPFTSYAGLRYLIPFLHRLVFIPGEPMALSGESNSGTWDLNSFKYALCSRR